MAIQVDNTDQDVLERFSAKKLVLALALVIFAEINKLRVINGDPEYTLNQFKKAIFDQLKQL